MNHATPAARPFSAHHSGPLKGEVRVPGDKSMSHRALMLGALAQGRTIIHGLLEGEDILHTAAAMRAMGAAITREDDGRWICEGVGAQGLREPAHLLDMGNSGTSTRILAGLVGGYNMTSFFTGDASLTMRPMKRIMTPLAEMGVTFMTRHGGRLPMAVQGTADIKPITYRLPIASAQVKSAILLAGVNAPKGAVTTVIEALPTRDHTENMLRHFGVEITVEKDAEGAEHIHLEGGQLLQAAEVFVPADPSSAAFPTVAALINEGSDISLRGVGMNERRSGIFTTLLEMGASIAIENERVEAGEKVADLRVRGQGPLKGIEVPPERVPSMIDEFPILAVAASCAVGITRMTGLEELRVKESDRLLMMATGLKDCGVNLQMGEDSLTIFGNGTAPRGGATIETALDHRIAMSFLILGTATQEPVRIDDIAPVNTSFPGFAALINGLIGAESLREQAA